MVKYFGDRSGELGLYDFHASGTPSIGDEEGGADIAKFSLYFVTQEERDVALLFLKSLVAEQLCMNGDHHDFICPSSIPYHGLEQYIMKASGAGQPKNGVAVQDLLAQIETGG
jgi:hypothetical protein